MTDLFEENEELIETAEPFDALDEENENSDISLGEVDARRRLESMLEEKRLRNELDDFADY